MPRALGMILEKTFTNYQQHHFSYPYVWPLT